MAKLLKLRRGTTSQHSSFTGAEGEVTIDTDKDTAVVHDGSTAAGRALAREDLNNVASASITGRLASESIAGAKIANDAIDSQHYAADSIDTEHYAPGSVDGTAIANNAITSAHIAPDTVVAADIGPDSVGASELADNSVASANIIDGSIVNADINASAAIAGSKISPDFGSQNITTNGDATINGGDLTVTGGEGTSASLFLVADQGDDNGDDWRINSNQDDNDLTISNNVSGSFVDKLTLKNDGNLDVTGGIDVTGNITVTGTVDGRDVASDGSKLDGIESGAKGDQTSTEIKSLLASDNLTDAHLAANSVGSSELKTDAVGSSDHIADNVINSEHYVDGSIDHEHLANDCVNGDNIANDSINSEHYVNGSIDHAHLANDCVDGTNIQDNSVNSEHYVDGSIDREHLNVTNSGSNGQALTRAGSQFTWATVSGDGGNAATLDGLDSTQFLRSDTTDQMTAGTLRIASGKLGVGNIDPGNSFANRSACIAIGDNDTGIAQNGDGEFEIWSNNQECVNVNTAGVQMNCGFGSVANIFGCRAWVNFHDGGSIQSDGNVSSVTDQSLGEYKVFIDNDMPDANYAVVASNSNGSTSWDDGDDGGDDHTIIGQKTTGHFFVFGMDADDGNDDDLEDVNCVVLR